MSLFASAHLPRKTFSVPYHALVACTTRFHCDTIPLLKYKEAWIYPRAYVQLQVGTDTASRRCDERRQQRSLISARNSNKQAPGLDCDWLV